MKKIEKSIHHLLEHNPFYANFFLDSRVVYDKYKVDTAAAAMTSKGPLLIFNTEFVEKLSQTEVTALIEHEILHLLFEHTSVHKKESGIRHKIANIAMDAAINQYIKGMPENCINLEYLNKKYSLNMLPEQTWTYYYSHLMRKAEELQNEKEFDEHDVDTGELGDWDDYRRGLRSSIDRALRGSKGQAPSCVLRAFDNMKNVSTVPWQQVLSNFIARASSSTIKNTRKKANRRFGLDAPGKVKKRELVLGVCVDSSGSVSDDSFELFLSEVYRISTLCSITYLVDADCVVQNVEVIKKGKPFKRERRGNGGTAYQPAIDECMKHRCDAILYFGDFDTADKPENPGVPFLWVGVGDSPKPADFGAEIRL